ncbi:thiopeptide-type bacteriocin biosynthesis protein [Thermocatellispora tengchongensis]|uniref:thiopeptide-type bacteriocin biosynthesis protein n=1 Tax=Thermocatellispora tengchongensis TaxID=1073253 RepID=UPI003642E14F
MLMPGASDLIHAQLLGHPERYDDILTAHLPRLLDSLPLVRWWFRRDRDTTRPDSLQQLWLYLHLASPAEYGQAATQLARFASDLHTRGLLAHLALAAYQPQTGRYGPGEAMTAAHEVAAADSEAALAQITMTARTGLPLTPSPRRQWRTWPLDSPPAPARGPVAARRPPPGDGGAGSGSTPGDAAPGRPG